MHEVDAEWSIQTRDYVPFAIKLRQVVQCSTCDNLIGSLGARTLVVAAAFALIAGFHEASLTNGSREIAWKLVGSGGHRGGAPHSS
jgi:hypothetical protein